jgi:hypothetical protein
LNQGNAGKVSQLKDAKAAAAPVGKICQDNEVLENGLCDNKVRRFLKHLYEPRIC